MIIHLLAVNSAYTIILILNYIYYLSVYIFCLSLFCGSVVRAHKFPEDIFPQFFSFNQIQMRVMHICVAGQLKLGLIIKCSSTSVDIHITEA